MKTEYKILIEGLNLHHVLAFFDREKIVVKDLAYKEQHALTLRLNKKDFLRFKKEKIAASYKITLLGTSGAENNFKNIFKHIGIVIGIIIVLCSLINMTSHLGDIKFDAGHLCQNQEKCILTEEGKQKILDVLEQNGIKRGAKISSLPAPREIEKLLVKSFDQISGVKVEQRGVNLHLDIIESKLPASQNTPDLVAPKSGFVVSASVSSGKLCVNVGDIVLEGQALVKAEEGIPVTAKIVLRTFYHEIDIYNEEKISYVRTGKKTTKHSLSFELFGIKGKQISSPYNLYEAQTKTQYVFYNLFVPLLSTTTTFWELSAVESIVPFEQVEQDFKTQLEEKTRQTLPDSAEEKNVTFATYKDGSKVRVDCYIEAYLLLKK